MCLWLCSKPTNAETQESSEMKKNGLEYDKENGKSQIDATAPCEMRPCAITFACLHHPPALATPILCPGEKKRLSTSKYDFGVSCIIKRSPSEDRALPLPKRKGRDPVPRGASFLKCRCPKTAPRRRKAPKRLAPSLLVTCPSWLARS